MDDSRRDVDFSEWGVVKDGRPLPGCGRRLDTTGDPTGLGRPVGHGVGGVGLTTGVLCVDIGSSP